MTKKNAKRESNEILKGQNKLLVFQNYSNCPFGFYYLNICYWTKQKPLLLTNLLCFYFFCNPVPMERKQKQKKPSYEDAVTDEEKVKIDPMRFAFELASSATMDAMRRDVRRGARLEREFYAKQRREQGLEIFI
jgi:hypothetical protein